jgi:hypothetical protein
MYLPSLSRIGPALYRVNVTIRPSLFAFGTGYGPHPLTRDPLRWVPRRDTGEGELLMR